MGREWEGAAWYKWNRAGDPYADAQESRDPMLQWAGSERKTATCSRTVTPHVAWTEWSTIEPAMSMSQRNGVSVLVWAGVGGGVSDQGGSVVSGSPGEAVTSAGKALASVWDAVAGASKTVETGCVISRLAGTVGCWGSGIRTGSGTQDRRLECVPGWILRVGCGLGPRCHTPRV